MSLWQHLCILVETLLLYRGMGLKGYELALMKILTFQFLCIVKKQEIL